MVAAAEEEAAAVVMVVVVAAWVETWRQRRRTAAGMAWARDRLPRPDLISVVVILMRAVRVSLRNRMPMPTPTGTTTRITCGTVTIAASLTDAGFFSIWDSTIRSITTGIIH